MTNVFLQDRASMLAFMTGWNLVCFARATKVRRSKKRFGHLSMGAAEIMLWQNATRMMFTVRLDKDDFGGERWISGRGTVSYTHLTLPTKRIV